MIPSQSPEVQLRSLLALEIESKRASGLYEFNDFTIEQAWIPFQELTELRKNHPRGKLYLMAAVADESANLSRDNLSSRQSGVIIGYQIANLKVGNVSVFDAYVDFVYQLQETCRRFKHDLYSWSRTEAMRDENGIPLNYGPAFSQGIFEAYFTAFYNFVVH